VALVDHVSARLAHSRLACSCPIQVGTSGHQFGTRAPVWCPFRRFRGELGALLEFLSRLFRRFLLCCLCASKEKQHLGLSRAGPKLRRAPRGGSFAFWNASFGEKSNKWPQTVAGGHFCAHRAAVGGQFVREPAGRAPETVFGAAQYRFGAASVSLWAFSERHSLAIGRRTANVRYHFFFFFLLPFRAGTPKPR